MVRDFRWVAALALPLILLGVLACTPKGTPPPTAGGVANPWNPSAPSPTPAGAIRVGSDACAPCHADIAARHSKTRHAATLYKATLAELGKLAPEPGEVEKGVRLVHQKGMLAVEAAHPDTKKVRGLPLGLALGSGKTGLTFLFLEEDGSAELYRSYFPAQKYWRITPGQEQLNKRFIGVPHSEPSTRQCLSCHAVTGPEQPMVPERKFFGVGCESCHGPGSTHVAAMEKGQPGPIANLKTLSGEEMNALCGKCHRTAKDVEAMGPIAKSSTNRFQPYGITLSKCFTKSSGKLTCVTCHDPHENAKTDEAGYVKTCLTCHDGSAKTKPLCPVNPKEKCIGCHMPTRDVFPGKPRLPIAMADHFIRKRPK